MTAAGHQHGNAHEHERFQGVSGLVVGATMLVGRGSLSRRVADLAEVARATTSSTWDAARAARPGRPRAAARRSPGSTRPR